MTVIIEDHGDARAPKTAKKGQGTDRTTRRSSRNGGFKRGRNAGADIDSLVASGADERFDMQGFGSPAPSAVEEPQPPDYFGEVNDVELPDYGLPGEPVEESIPEPVAEDNVPEPEPAVEVEEFEPEPPVAHKRPSLGGAKRRQVIDEEEEEDAPPPPKRGAQRFLLDGKESKKPKTSRLVKEKPAKKSKPIQANASKPKKGFITDSPKPKKAKAPKAPKDDFMNPAGPVVRAPESILSQIVTLVEVGVAGVLFFFGAMQVGNILISNIVNGTLGG